MAHLEDSNSQANAGLKAITINGCIHVESEEDVRRRAERRANRKSRWGQQQNDQVTPQFGAPAPKKSHIYLPDDDKKSLSRVTPLTSSRSLAPIPAGLLMSTSINASAMSDSQQQMYLLKMQIQDASVRLGRPDLGIPVNPRDRSPSPEPVYNSKGMRINKREDRVRNQLINQRNAAITKLKALDPTYQPPTNFKYKNTELEDKVLIPHEEYPNINFMGLLLGPRGRFLDEMKKKTNCNIVIRGKGSLRTGMTGIDKIGKKFDALDEPLHAFIQGTTAEDVKAAVKEITDLINMQVYQPESEKAVALRSRHMHELAVLNGTLKDIDMKCMNCGRPGHKTWECGDASIFTSSVICSACGGVGHVTKDCKQRRPGSTFNKVEVEDPETLDKEYDEFLKDLTGDRDDKGKSSTKSSSSSSSTSELLQDSSRHRSSQIGSGTGTGGGQRLMLLGPSGEAPGAASARARAISAGQNAGGMLKVMGKSMFGGKLTRITAGYKSQGELELERKKKIQEQQNQPVPLEWQVEKYESRLNESQDAYLANLERSAQQERLERSQMNNFSIPPPGYSMSGLPNLQAPMANGLPNMNTGNPWNFNQKR